MLPLTREFFDLLIIVVIVIGAALAAVRLYRDLTRRLPPNEHVLWTQYDRPRAGDPAAAPTETTLPEQPKDDRP
jgi:hypothetical protein